MSTNVLQLLLENGIVDAKTEKQKRVLTTAIRLFSEKGYANTSTSEIAKEANVSEGLIFKYYQSKEQLLMSLIIRFVTDFSPEIGPEFLESFVPDPQMTLEGFIRQSMLSRMRIIEANKDLFQVFFKELMYREELKRELVPLIMAKFVPLLTAAIEHFKVKGELVDLPTERIVKLLFMSMGGFLVSHFILSEDGGDVEDQVRFIVKGLSANGSD